MEKLNLFTVSGDGINGTVWTDQDEMLEAVRAKYGPCDLGISDGTILDPDDKLVATFGRE